MSLQKSPQFADFLKSATGQLSKLPTCPCTNSPPTSLQIFWNLPLDSYLSYLHVLAEILPSLQIFWNLPLDSYLSYLHVLAQIPPPSLQIFWNCHWTVTYMSLQKFPPHFADFLKSATGQLPKLPTCTLTNPPPVCRFSEICHWTVT